MKNQNLNTLTTYTFTVVVWVDGKRQTACSGFPTCSKAMAYAEKVYAGLNCGVVATPVSN